MVTLWGRDGYQLSMACGSNAGTGLGAWDNAQAALVVGEIKGMDWLYKANILHTKPATLNASPAPGTHYEKRLANGRNLGSLTSVHYLQTGILTFNLMGACTTAGVGDPYTHTITKIATTAPTRLAFHVEKEGITANRRKDMMGFVGKSLDISVSEKNTNAFQTFSANFSFTGAGANLAAPTALTQTNVRPLTWFDYKNASGGSGFTYNAGAINQDIISIDMHLGWKDAFLGTYDGNGYYTNGLYIPPFKPYIKLGIRYTDAAGTLIDDLSDLAHTAYAGDLDFVVDFYESASRYLKYTFDKCYIVPDYEEKLQEEGDWYDGVEITLEPLNETSSVAVEEKNYLTKVWYEHD